MLESSGFWRGVCGTLCALVPASCALVEPKVAQPAPKPAAVAPIAAPTQALEEKNLAEEARAMLAQAETDVQRARARRALWSSAWEDLVASRQAFAARDHAKAIRHAKRASEFAQLGLEQLAYPAVK